MGRSPERIPAFLKVLEQLWEENPELRFGQLITLIVNDKEIPFNWEESSWYNAMSSLMEKEK